MRNSERATDETASGCEQMGGRGKEVLKWDFLSFHVVTGVGPASRACNFHLWREQSHRTHMTAASQITCLICVPSICVNRGSLEYCKSKVSKANGKG